MTKPLRNMDFLQAVTTAKRRISSETHGLGYLSALDFNFKIKQIEAKLKLVEPSGQTPA